MSLNRSAKRDQHLKEFRNLALHESMAVNDEVIVTRVIGGWIYETRIEAHNDDEPLGWAVTNCFVPYTTEKELFDAK